MSLRNKLNMLDDVALEAFASKGLVKRAHRDITKAAISVVSETDDQIEISFEEWNLTLRSPRLTDARCGCPAVGVCRHILSAVVFLRKDMATVDEAAQGEEPGKPNTALTDLAEPELIAFAGSTLTSALSMAQMGSTDIKLGDSISIRFVETGDQVVFPNTDKPLAGAIFKGKESRRKQAVVAAALAVRHQAGMGWPEHALDTENSAKQVDADTLQTISDALEASLAPIIAGTPILAREQLFMLAVSARTEAAPRLAGQLNGCVTVINDLIHRTPDITPADVLARLANCAALVAALKKRPDDITLLGRITRDYVPEGPIDVAMLGASKWHSPSGARGLTLWGYNSRKGWLRMTDARGAGLDPDFSPNLAWSKSMFAQQTPNRLIGHWLRMEEGKVSADHALTIRQSGRKGTAISVAVLEESGAVQDNFFDVLQDFRTRIGYGLRRAPSTDVALLKIQNSGKLFYDNFVQRWIWPVYDGYGSFIPLRLAEQNQHHQAGIESQRRRISHVLVELKATDRSLEAQPLTVIFDQGDIIQLDFDRIPVATGFQKFTDRLQETMTKPSETAAKPIDPIMRLSSDVLETLMDSLMRAAPSDQLKTLQTRAGAYGMNRLAASLEDIVQNGPDPSQCLRAAYMAGEILQMRASQV